MKAERLGIALLTIGLLTNQSQAGLISHWAFDESGGPIAYDSAGSFDGTLSGGAAFVGGGISGNAISLSEASGSLVNIGTSFPGFTSGDFSLVAWVKTTTSDDSSVIVSKHLAGSVNGYLLNINTTGSYGAANKAMFYDSTPPGGEAISTTTVNDGVWHQIAGVYTAGGNIQIYVDGSPAENTKSSKPIVANTAPFLVGGVSISGTPTALFNGLVDDVQVYGDALTSGEVQFLYNNPGLVVPEPSTALLLALGAVCCAATRRARENISS